MKKTKVLVTGVFDVLHQEHLNFLKAAKLEGDVLVVGLESDERVKKLKGSSRPINSINTRLKNLRQLGIANKIFTLPKKFNQSADHLALINQIKPDILAVSSHTPNLPAKRRLLKQIGGKVKVVHLKNPKLSTSKLLQ